MNVDSPRGGGIDSQLAAGVSTGPTSWKTLRWADVVRGDLRSAAVPTVHSTVCPVQRKAVAVKEVSAGNRSIIADDMHAGDACGRPGKKKRKKIPGRVGPVNSRRESVSSQSIERHGLLAEEELQLAALAAIRAPFGR